MGTRPIHLRASGRMKVRTDRILRLPSLRRRGGRPCFLRADGVVLPNVTAVVRMLSTLIPAILLLSFAVQAQRIVVAEDDSPHLEALLNILRSGNSEQKRTALAEIRNLGTEHASRLALPALRDKDEIVRATAAGSVVFLPSSEAA